MNPTVREGSFGAAVERLTEILVERGFLEETTHTFGRLVRMAVKEFQSRHVDERGRALVVDGIVGPLTWWALENEDNRSILEPPPLGDLTALPPEGGSPRGRAALAVALAEMRDGAREQGANNSGPWIEKYLNGILDPPANWCAAFVSWCYDQHPNGAPFRYSLGARNIREQFRNKGWLYDSEEVTPEPGDIIVWWRDQPNSWKGHIGLVHHVSAGIVYTVEGNKGGFPAPVNVFDYVQGRIDKLLGFGRVPDIFD
ncbi:MAG: CHAP domain-containing protein [Acidobacteriota bacterium]